ncbi:MAG: hypothetical protein IPL32_20275 [Chloracidobacterium sp.]|nr:hypothetical protein [Chloracidobacterium sp.]
MNEAKIETILECIKTIPLDETVYRCPQYLHLEIGCTRICDTNDLKSLANEHAAAMSEVAILKEKIETSIAVLGRVDAAFNGVEDLGIADDVDTLRRQLRKAITKDTEPQPFEALNPQGGERDEK